MQINQNSSVTRAGVQRNSFGPARKLSPTKPKHTMGGSNQLINGGNQLPKVLEIGTEETVIRNMDHRLIQSPSIKDVAFSGNQITPASSLVSLPKEFRDSTLPLEKGDASQAEEVGFFTLRPTQPMIED